MYTAGAFSHTMRGREGHPVKGIVVVIVFPIKEIIYLSICCRETAERESMKMNLGERMIDRASSLRK